MKGFRGASIGAPEKVVCFVVVSDKEKKARRLTGGVALAVSVAVHQGGQGPHQVQETHPGGGGEC